VDPAFEPWLERAWCARRAWSARCWTAPASRRRADPPSLESRPSSRASRFAGAAAVRARAPPLAILSLSRRHGTHPRFSPKSCLFWARALGHTHPRRARTLMPSSRPSPPGALLAPRFVAGAHRPVHTTAGPNLYLPDQITTHKHTGTRGAKPCPICLTCARARTCEWVSTPAHTPSTRRRRPTSSRRTLSPPPRATFLPEHASTMPSWCPPSIMRTLSWPNERAHALTHTSTCSHA
jgi:hypothetical protein